MKFLMPLVIALSLCLVGCRKPPEEFKFDVQSFHLPANASNVKSLGNYWYSFELEINGKRRQFLYRAYRMDTNCATETITELRD